MQRKEKKCYYEKQNESGRSETKKGKEKEKEREKTRRGFTWTSVKGLESARSAQSARGALVWVVSNPSKVQCALTK